MANRDISGVTLLHKQIHSTQHGGLCFVYTEYKHVACKIPTAAKLIRRNKQDDMFILTHSGYGGTEHMKD